MITKEAIAVYKKFDGNLDNWSRSGTSKDRQLLTSDQFYTIDSLVQDLKLIQSNLASEQFILRTNKELEMLLKDEQAVEVLKSLIDY